MLLGPLLTKLCREFSATATSQFCSRFPSGHRIGEGWKRAAKDIWGHGCVVCDETMILPSPASFWNFMMFLPLVIWPQSHVRTNPKICSAYWHGISSFFLNSAPPASQEKRRENYIRKSRKCLNLPFIACNVSAESNYIWHCLHPLCA